MLLVADVGDNDAKRGYCTLYAFYEPALITSLWNKTSVKNVNI
jgi:hypothetical protein